jgi:hypothetical protein
MNKRILTVAIVLGIAGLGVAVLTAAKDAGDKAKETTTAPASNPTIAKKLVVLGYVDTEEPLAKLFPDNFPMASKVKNVLVKEGDPVEAGQKLLEFDVTQFELKVKQSELGIKAAEHEKTKAKATIDTQPYQVNAAEFEVLSKQEEVASKKAQLDDVLRLFSLQKSNEAERKAAESAVKSAEHALEAAKWKVKLLKDFTPNFLMDLAQSGVDNATNLKQQAEEARNLLSCKAPAKGRILRVFAVDGMNFGPASREPAFWFMKDGPLLVRAEVPQEFARRMKKDLIAKIECDSDSTLVWKGKVVKVADQFLPKRLGGGGGSEIMQVADDRVLECLVSIEIPKDGQAPRYGQKVKVTLGE